MWLDIHLLAWLLNQLIIIDVAVLQVIHNCIFSGWRSLNQLFLYIIIIDLLIRMSLAFLQSWSSFIWVSTCLTCLSNSLNLRHLQVTSRCFVIILLIAVERWSLLLFGSQQTLWRSSILCCQLIWRLCFSLLTI